MQLKPPRVGQFLDVANLQISGIEDYGPDARIDFEKLNDFVKSLGSPVVSQAFCTVNVGCQNFLHHLNQLGYRVEALPGRGASNGPKQGNADALLAFSLCEAIARHRIGTVVLGSGDGDFAPIVDILIHRHIETIVIGPSRHSASRLVLAASRFYSLEDLGLIISSCRKERDRDTN